MRTESAFTGLFLIGIIFRLLHFPGGSLFVILALSTLALLYFPFGFFFLSDKSIKNQNTALSIVTGLFLSTLVIGIEFGILNWPGANVLLIIGAISVIITLALTLSQKQTNKEESRKRYYDRLAIRQIFFLLVGLVAFFL
ncbi:MAG: hypothetical protein EOO50_05520 [Flavobacterium sp.]|uniref:hypothetical protein n=1 Tax=Flavobacterium sp. TaxID=239 RepID=UPI00121FAC72|nr:hypothetical protein [Flavobacterium sp.]RZJ67447.1 MAG: hypothetical protein EOO50_05520 [Flavobacterium sp.]